MAYVTYYDDNPDQYASNPVTVHFVDGIYNGILTPDKTNSQIDAILQKAPYTNIDLFGSKVHSVWETSALLSYCKGRYRQYMNILDTLVTWEQRLIGLEKYDRVPKNKTMAYVNYDYYMYQGAFGVSYKYDTQNRACNPTNLLYSDDDVIWGLSHEWGHQHQMTPYFCWTGLSESSNNMNSCYNVLHMGYKYSEGYATRIQNNWTAAYNHFFNDTPTTATSASYIYVGANKGNYTYNTSTKVGTAVTAGTGDYVHENEITGAGGRAVKRIKAYDNRANFSCTEFQEGAATQYANTYGNVIPTLAADPEHSLSTSEVYAEENTVPFFMLYCYFSANGVPDYAQDLYESLRQTDNTEGSTVEKQTGVDKYELLASVQNGNKNSKYATFAASYPNSCWITRGYVGTSNTYIQNSVPFIFNYIRKASRICGYNLFPFFDKFGFMKQIYLCVDDYGNKYYAMTSYMKDEFKADMEALNLKTLTDAMIETISHTDIPTFDRPVIPN